MRVGLPYQGEVPIDNVVKVAKALYDMGCYESVFGDTIWRIGTPLKAQEMLAAVADQVPMEKLALHFHNTYGQALANIMACLPLGVATIDSAVAGLGGCPYAKGASGNVATEDVVYMLNGMGIKTGIDLNKLIAAGAGICKQLNHGPRSQVAIAELAKQGNKMTSEALWQPSADTIADARMTDFLQQVKRRKVRLWPIITTFINGRLIMTKASGQ